MEKEANKSFVRWQGIAVKQLSYAINLILVLSVGGLSFEAALLTNSNVVLEPCWQQQAFLVSLIMLPFAVAFGILATISRLNDFRLTKNIALAREKLETSNLDLNAARARAKILGKITWAFFWAELGAYAFGVFLMALVIFSIAYFKFG
jgi:hypothetical protein